MAISKNFLLTKVSGHIGKQVVLKQYGELTLITKYPDMSRRKLSPKQIRRTEIMEQAVNETKGVMASEEERNAAQLRLNVTRNKLYHTLIGEYFKKVKEAEEKAL